VNSVRSTANSMPLPTVLFIIVFNPFEIEVGPKTVARMGLLTSVTFPSRQRYGNLMLQEPWTHSNSSRPSLSRRYSSVRISTSGEGWMIRSLGSERSPLVTKPTAYRRMYSVKTIQQSEAKSYAVGRRWGVLPGFGHVLSAAARRFSSVLRRSKSRRPPGRDP